MEGWKLKLRGNMAIDAQGHLHIAGNDTVDLARRFGTPLYIIDEDLVRDICRQYRQEFIEKAGGEVLYASKAFLTLAMCKLIQEEGLGLDVVSGGELFTALQAGFPSNRIYFHGNNKQPDELKLALQSRVGRIVIDNIREIDLVEQIAESENIRAQVLLRVTPGVEAHTHEYIKTGQIDSKFGFTVPNGDAMRALQYALTKSRLIVSGLHCHIGSQIFDMNSFGHAAGIMMQLLKDMKTQLAWEAQELNLGGGFGIFYADGDTPASIASYAEAVLQVVGQKSAELNLSRPKIIVEPGRSIIAEAGTTLYTIGSIKNIPGVRTYLAVDGGMTDNPRYALYKSRYEACIANKADQPAEELVTITGKCCESGDMLIWDIALPKAESGDLLAVACTGAYNYSMSMNYNRIGRPAVVLVKAGEADIIVERESYLDLIRNDRIPPRMQRQ